jgi:Phytanoyl-CoA dioxygenase (PhyH)
VELNATVDPAVAAADPASVLDDATVRRYRRDGYLTLPRLLHGSGLDELRAVYDSLFARRRSTDTGDYYDIAGRAGEDGDAPRLPQIIHPEKYEPGLLETAHYRAARALAGRLLDHPAEQLDVFGHMILKPAGYGVETPWHQDEAYMDPAWENRGLSIWTPLDEATMDSGCLHFVPGSHLGEVVPHFHIGHDTAVRGLATETVDPALAVPCPVPAGAATVHDCRTLHYAGPNRTGTPRRAYVLVFKAPARPVANPRPRDWLSR